MPSTPPTNADKANGVLRFGASGYCSLGKPLATSISDKGASLSKGCAGFLDIYDGTKEFSSFGLELSSGETKGKILPTTNAAGTYSVTGSTYLKFLSGKHEFATYPSNDKKVFLSTGSNTAVGLSRITAIGGTRTLEGKVYKLPSEKANLWEIGKSFNATGHLKVGESGLAIAAGPSLYYGVGYNRKFSPHNKIRLEPSFALGLKYIPDVPKSEEVEDAELGDLPATQELYDIAVGAVQRRMMGNVLGAPQEELSKSGLSTGPSKGPDSMFMLSGLEATSSFLGAASAENFRFSKHWFWTHTAAKGLGGAISMFGETHSERTGGASELLSTGRRLLFAGFENESPSSRKNKNDDELSSDLFNINLISLGAYSAFMALGAAGHSSLMMRSGAGANLSLALNPDPIGVKGFVRRTSYMMNTSTRGRAGVSVKKSLKGGYYSEAHVASRSFTGSNLANALNPTKNYSGTDPVSSTGASFGKEWELGPVALRVGPDLVTNYGGGSGNVAAIGLKAGAEVLIPFTEKKNYGLTLGVTGSGHMEFPSGKFQKEATIGIGFFVKSR